MKFDRNKYHYYTTKDNTVIAASTYAGRTVKGVAKCDPADNFDIEKGKNLAAARCNHKVAMKRLKRASQKYVEAEKAAIEAVEWFNKIQRYYMDSVDALDEATAELVNLAENM